jgi:hypothetical protein
MKFTMTENNRRFPAEWEQQGYFTAFHIMVKIGQENTNYQWAFVEFKKNKSIRNRISCSVR